MPNLDISGNFVQSVHLPYSTCGNLHKRTSSDVQVNIKLAVLSISLD